MAMPITEQPPPNYQFGPYVVRACIGRGAMAHVYRCEHLTLRRTVALKVVDRWVLDHPYGNQRFLEEALSAAAIKHPNVVNIIDVGTWSGRPYIVMEFLGGRDLERGLSERGPLPDHEVASLALPIVSGLMAVHNAGVTHRDVKPSNIFLWNGPDGEIVPKLLDFGISKYGETPEDSLEVSEKSREIVGTPMYMAPEALEGGHRVGPHSDQYSLGAVLYACAVGRPPFRGETVPDILKAIAVRDLDTPRSVRPQISPALERVIMRAMNVDPAARFQSLRELGRALWPLADERTRMIYSHSFGAQLPALPPPPLPGSTGPLVLPTPHHPPPPPASELQTLTPPPKKPWLWLTAAAAMLSLLVLLLLWRQAAGPRAASDVIPRVGMPVAAVDVAGGGMPPKSTAAGGEAGKTSAPPATTQTIAVQHPAEPKPSETLRLKSSARPKPRQRTSPRRSSFRASRGRSRPTTPIERRTTDREVNVEDADLAELFSVSVSSRDALDSADTGELGGLFYPGDSPAVGANASPLLD